jgi:hypothetical protein
MQGFHRAEPQKIIKEEGALLSRAPSSFAGISRREQSYPFSSGAMRLNNQAAIRFFLHISLFRLHRTGKDSI